MKNAEPDSLVSVIIPTYNGEQYLEEALLSVFSQTYKNYEVIVVDDGSLTDKVKQICGRYADQLTYLRQDNQGPSAARNRGIRHSKGEYVAFLDDDDMWLPEKLEKQVRFYGELKARGLKPGLVYTGCHVISEDGTPVCKILRKTHGHDYTKLMFINFIVGIDSVMVARPVLDSAGWFDEDLRSREDWDLWLRIAKNYELYFLDDFLTRVRIRRDSLSTNIPSMISNQKIFLSKILAREAQFLSMNKGLKRKLLRYHNAEMVFGFYGMKDYAYGCLFKKRDARAFRRSIRQAMALDLSVLNWKVAVYYVLSLISAGLCVKIKSVKKNAAGDKKWADDICDVREISLSR